MPIVDATPPVLMPRKVTRVDPGRVSVRLKPGTSGRRSLKSSTLLLFQELFGDDGDRRRDVRDGLRALLGGDDDLLAEADRLRRIVGGAGEGDGVASWAPATLAASRPARASRFVLQGRMKDLPCARCRC
jgi:hypothetical protein